MRCFKCEKLRLEWESATAAHLDMIRMREDDFRGLPSGGPTIWDFILEVAVTARTDAHDALEDHLASHYSTSIRSVSIALLALISQSDICRLPQELLEAL